MNNSLLLNFYLLKKRTFISAISIIISVSFISCSAVKKTNKKIEKEFQEANEFRQGFSGLVIYDPVSQNVLYAHNGDKYFTPASNTKLFTLFTGLKILGDSVPALKYTIKRDSLFFKGTGDPSLMNPDLPESEVLEFLKKEESSLIYVPPVYKEKALGPGWAWGDYDSYYSAERIDLPVYGNLVKVEFKAGNSAPIVTPKKLQDSIFPVEIKGERNKYAQRDFSSNRLEYQNFNREKDFRQYVPFKFSEELITGLLSDTLKRDISVYKGNPENLEFDKTIYSIPSDSIYKRMMQVSDNFIAEQILLMAADKISDTLKTDIAIEYMKKEHLNDLPDEPQWYDGSGLSRYNLFTPRTMVKLIEKIETEMPKEELFKILAVGGESGTLKNYYKAETPYIYAKTGTLKNNHSLSGFLVTKSGRTLIFSFMNSSYTVPTSELKAGMTRILEQIRDNY